MEIINISLVIMIILCFTNMLILIIFGQRQNRLKDIVCQMTEKYNKATEEKERRKRELKHSSCLAKKDILNKLGNTFLKLLPDYQKSILMLFNYTGSRLLNYKLGVLVKEFMIKVSKEAQEDNVHDN